MRRENQESEMSKSKIDASRKSRSFAGATRQSVCIYASLHWDNTRSLAKA